MTIFKSSNMTAVIKSGSSDIGDLGAKFYTQDINTTSFNIRVMKDDKFFNFNEEQYKPYINLFMGDGSIFLDEELEILEAENGLIAYNLKDKVKHAGWLKAKLILKKDSESIHVTDFRMEIIDSGLDKAVAKEIDVDILMKTFEDFAQRFPEKIRGKAFTYDDFTEEQLALLKGDKGDKGEKGAKGDKGERGQEGKSAYEIAVANGFTGSESEWIAYLKELPNSLKFDAQNLITNGNFLKGTIGFSAYANDSTLAVSNSVLTATGKGNYGTVGVSTQAGYRFIGKAGQKLYIKARMRVTNSDASNIKVYAIANGKTVSLNGTDIAISRPLINVWYDVDGFITMPSEFEGQDVSLFFISQYANSSIASGKVFEIYRPLAFNVSNTFGKTFIPTIEDIRKYLSNYSNNWFDGTVSFIDMKDYVGNLKNEIDQNKNDLLNHINKDYLGKYDILTDFTEAWKISDNATGVTVNTDYSKLKTGSSSKRLTVIDSIDIAKGIETTTNTLIANKTKAIQLKVWVDKAADVKNLTVYFGNEQDIWGNYARFIIVGDAAGKREKTGGALRDGWNYITLAPLEATLINNFDWNKAVKRIKVTVTAKTAKATVVFDSIQYNGVGTPKIVFTFDDGWKTVYDNAYPKMKEVGIVGTHYVIGQYVDNPSNPLSVDIASLEQLKEMEANGWVHSNHTWQHNYYFGGKHTPESYLETLDKNRLWMLNNGIGYNFDGASHVCYPNGEYDRAVIALMKARGYKSARAAACRQSMPIQIDNKYELTSRNFTKDVTLEQAKKWIDVAIESGGTTFLQFHQIPLDDTTSNGNENPYISWSKDKFLGLIDYVVGKGLVNHCMTHAEWFEWAEYNKLI